MARKGETWNESQVYRDSWTLRQVRQVTTQGLYNQTPTYETPNGFTADGEFLIFASGREGYSAVFRCHVPTGDITQLTDPVPAMGAIHEWHCVGVGLGTGLGIADVLMAIAPRSRWAVYVQGSDVRAVHIDTLQERTLLSGLDPAWQPCVLSVDASEKYVVVPLMHAHPDILAGRRPTRSWMQCFATGEGTSLRLLRVPLAGGPAEVFYEEPGIAGAHCPYSPTDPDLLLMHRDCPPKFWGGSDGKTNRIWTWRPSTGKLTELAPRDKSRFQVHSSWTWDGKAILYHGPSTEGGYFIGVVDTNGQTIREYGFHQATSYGHVTSMAGRPAMILDGNLSSDLLLWLYYDAEQPRIEVICRHGTEWRALPGQYTHPHPLSDPTGRWISFNVARAGRADVYVVKV